MSGARSGLHESRLKIVKVLNREDLAGRVCAVLGEGSRKSDAVRLEVLAEKQLAPAAVEAFSAEFLVLSAAPVLLIPNAALTETSATTRSPTLKPLTSFPSAAMTPTTS